MSRICSGQEHLAQILLLRNARDDGHMHREKDQACQDRGGAVYCRGDERRGAESLTLRLMTTFCLRAIPCAFVHTVLHSHCCGDDDEPVDHAHIRCARHVARTPVPYRVSPGRKAHMHLRWVRLAHTRSYLPRLLLVRRSQPAAGHTTAVYRCRCCAAWLANAVAAPQWHVLDATRWVG